VNLVGLLSGPRGGMTRSHLENGSLVMQKGVSVWSPACNAYSTASHGAGGPYLVKGDGEDSISAQFYYELPTRR
jgi:hypothetical protein